MSPELHGVWTAGRFPSSSELPMHGPHPEPREDRWPALVAGLVFAAGVVLLVYALSSGSGRTGAVPAADAVAPAGALQPALTVVAGPQPAVEAPAKAAPAPRPH